MSKPTHGSVKESIEVVWEAIHQWSEIRESSTMWSVRQGLGEDDVKLSMNIIMDNLGFTFDKNGDLTEAITAEGGTWIEGPDGKGLPPSAYNVFNYTDGIPASDKFFKTKEEAEEFIKNFRKSFEFQGFYLTSSMERISPDDVDLRIDPCHIDTRNNK